MFARMTTPNETAVRGAPKTRATSIRLRELLADFVGPQRARAVVERMTGSGLLPQGTRRFSTPISVREATLSLIVATCDAGDALAAIDRAMRVAACERYVGAGEPSGPTVIDALTAAIEAVRDDANVEPREWHFGLACTKELLSGDRFEV